MGAYILRRLILLIPVMLIVGVVVFMLIHITPGDPAAVMLGDRATGEQIEQLRESMGLNEPLFVQFVEWFSNALRLDFGDSFFLDMPVTEALRERAQPTLLLTTYALLIEILIGVPCGVIAAIKRNSIIDRWLMIMSIAGAAIPTFFLGIMLILIFAVQLQWLPSGGYVPIQEDPQEHFKSMILPAFSSASRPRGCWRGWCARRCSMSCATTTSAPPWQRGSSSARSSPGTRCATR